MNERIKELQAEQELFDMDDHPPHRLCECRKCMEYFTPLPDCDAFAAFGKPIAEQEPVVDLSKVNHEDKCRYFDDETFCDCGADLYELLKWYRNKPVRTKDLTDDEIETIFEYWYSQPETEVWSTVDLARAVIAAYKEKNRG